jgi:predicted HicB family RNase H-like nuclease
MMPEKKKTNPKKQEHCSMIFRCPIEVRAEIRRSADELGQTINTWILRRLFPPDGKVR